MAHRYGLYRRMVLRKSRVSFRPSGHLVSSSRLLGAGSGCKCSSKSTVLPLQIWFHANLSDLSHSGRCAVRHSSVGNAILHLNSSAAFSIPKQLTVVTATKRFAKMEIIFLGEVRFEVRVIADLPEVSYGGWNGLYICIAVTLPACGRFALDHNGNWTTNGECHTSPSLVPST